MSILLRKFERATGPQSLARMAMPLPKSATVAGLCLALLSLSGQLGALEMPAEKAHTGEKISSKAEGNSPDLAAIQQSADYAQQRCYEYMHDDANEYTSCLNALLSAVKGKSSAAKQQRLGIAYFAWVGAANSARLSMPGAELAAQLYLPQFKALQKQLHISDEALCTTIAGDCKARLAQIAQMEKELQENKARASKAAKSASASAKHKGNK